MPNYVWTAGLSATYSAEALEFIRIPNRPGHPVRPVYLMRPDEIPFLVATQRTNAADYLDRTVKHHALGVLHISQTPPHPSVASSPNQFSEIHQMMPKLTRRLPSSYTPEIRPGWH